MSMSVETPRRIGRPDQQASEELVRHIVEEAARLFIEQGYTATSIEQVAGAAGSGKQTIYRRFGSKEGLFLAVLKRTVDRLVELARSAETLRPKPIDALKESCSAFLDYVLQPDMIQLQRVLVAEVGRFPELGDYLLTCLRPFKEQLERQIKAAMDAGQLRPMDVELAFTLVCSVTTGWPAQQAKLGLNPFDGLEGGRDAYFEAAWELFLKGAG